jgi:putative holliday junction resolvase
MTALGFDYGLKHLGVAVGQTITDTATALETVKIRNGKPDWGRIGALIGAWQPDLLVVGEPLNMDGSEQAMTKASRRFARQLHGRYGMRVELVDERLSTVEARERLAEQGRSGQADHPVAAQVLLETWLHDASAAHPASPQAGEPALHRET